MSLPTNSDSGRTNFRTSVINLERPGNPDVFGEQIRRDAANLIARYPEGQARSALLPLLHLVQSEQGCITPDGVAFCSDVLGITKAQVSAVATFYTMYKRTPTGEYLVSVCTNTLCGLLGGDEIFAAVSDTLGIANNESTSDGVFTIERAECLAACDYAPVVTVNYEFYDNQTPQSTTELVGKLQAGERPQPTRGAPLCTFKQAERQIAGFFTPEDYALESTASGAPTEAGVRLALQRGDSAPSYAVDDSSARTGADAERAATAAGQGPSQDDAPLSTAESDPENSTSPGATREN